MTRPAPGAPPTRAELEAFADKWCALAPPLTQQQVSNLRRLMRPRSDRRSA
jgi:hypothetical protein